MAQYPNGKCSPDDEGALSIAISIDHKANVVRMDFGKPVAWLGMDAETCDRIAVLLFKHAQELKKWRGNTTITQGDPV